MDDVAYIVAPRLSVTGANAIQGPYSWGYPSPTAFLGYGRAVVHKARAKGLDISFRGVGIMSHEFHPREAGKYGDRFSRRAPSPVVGTGVVRSAPLVPEGLADITTSLIIAVEGDSIYDEGIAETFEWLSWGQPLAGGAVQSNRPWLMYQRPDPKDVFRRLGPGTLLLSRSLFLEQHYQQQRAAGRKLSRLDAVLDICEIRYTYNGSEWACQSLKNEWLVPLPGGYAGISPVYDPGVVKGARSPSVPCQFAEPTLTLGAWVSPRKVTDLADVVWNYAYEDPYYNCLTVEKEQHGLKEEEDSSDDGNEGDGGD